MNILSASFSPLISESLFHKNLKINLTIVITLSALLHREEAKTKKRMKRTSESKK